ncbi:MAG: hypothetical protein M1480_02505 [Bacteroidetes bacterium]|nr:hypothetical protein [Bacteroidota bacterium]
MKKAFIILLSIIFIDSGFSQDLNQNLSKVAGQYAESYLQPFINSYGAAMNSGFFSSMKTENNDAKKFHLSFTIESIGSFIPQAEKTFSAVYNTTAVIDTMGQSQTVAAKATINNAPTIFGSRDLGTAIIEINDTVTIAGIYDVPVHQTRVESTFGSVANTDVAPMFVPQLNIGTVFGTDLFFRWLPSFNLGNYGNTNYFGIGIRHNVSQYLKNLPVNILAYFSYQNFNINDSTGNEYLSASAYAAGFQVSKSFGIFNLYGGLQYEGSNLKVNYTYIPPSNSSSNSNYRLDIAFNLSGKNNFRILAGASVSLGPVSINSDLNLSGINVISLGIGYNIF